MNIYEIIKKELDEKSKDWNIYDKLNYIYIRTLQLLTHDSRWNYSTNQELKNNLFDKDVNVFNLDDKRVICSSWSKIYADLVSFILTEDDKFDVAFTEGTREPHMYTRVFLSDGTTLDYDPLRESDDFVRAKRNLPLKGIKIYNNKTSWENEINIEFSLEKIGYKINKIYYLKELKKLLLRGEFTPEELMDTLLKNINYEDLGLTELNTFLNMQLRKLTGRTLNSYGITFDNIDENRVIIKTQDKELYDEKEINNKVNIYKL